MAPAADRDGPVLDAEEASRRGWRCATVNFILRDFLDRPILQGQLYARFEASNGDQSDGYSMIEDGSATFKTVWVPDDNGRMWLYVNAAGLGELQDGISYDANGQVVQFFVVQKHQTKQVTVSEAMQHGWTQDGSAEENWQRSDGQEYGMEEEVTVRLPLPNLEIRQTA